MEGFECFHHQTAYRHDHEPVSLRYAQRPEGHGIAFLKAIQRIVSSNLLLVRAEGRQQELAIRAALGASRARMASELLFESAVLGLMGSVLGLVLAYGALGLLVMLAPHGPPRLQEIGHRMVDGPGGALAQAGLGPGAECQS